MKISIYLRFSITLILFCVSHHYVKAQDIMEVSYKETFQPSYSISINLPALPKHNRVSSKATSIIINDGKDFDNEQLQKVVDYVTSVWKSYVLNSKDLLIQIEWENIDSDIETIVRYAHKDGLAYPVALKSHLDQADFIDKTTPDGIIKINPNIKWDYALGDNISADSKNLTFGLMRAFARIMGFGSDCAVDHKNNYYFMDKRYHTIFNTLVSNSNGKKLSSINTNNGNISSELKTFAEEPNQSFWINTNNNQYRLASPPYSVDTPPFVYLDDNKSLMKKNISIGNYILQVDESTKEILNQLGWNTQDSFVTITSNDVPSTGLASAYKEHKFSIDKGSATISDPIWSLRLPLAKGGENIIYLKDDNHSCTTPALSNIDIYKRNVDGDIEGQLELKFKLNGNEVNAFPFKIYFELAPYIEYAVIEDIEDEFPYSSYNAYYKVKYKGAEKVYVYVEEEFGTDVRVTTINEPFIATGVAKHILSPYHAWIDFEVENKYGNSLYTIELQPYGIIAKTSNDTSTRTVRLSNQTIDVDQNDKTERIDIYDAIGNHITSIDDLSDLEGLNFKGLLIIYQVGKNGNTKTFKFWKK